MTPKKRLPQLPSRLAAGAMVAFALLVANAATTHAAPFPPTISGCGTTTTTTATTTTTVIAVTPLSITLGDDIVLVLNTSAGTSGTVSATDDAGNTYALRANGARSASGSVTTAVLDSLGVAAVPTTITITHPTAASRNAICLVNSSGSSIAFFDAVSGSGSVAGTDTSDIGLPPPDVLIVAAVGRVGPSVTWTPADAGYTQSGSTLITGAPAVEVDAWWQTRTDACVPPCNGDGTLSAARSHIVHAVAYRWGGQLAAEAADLSGGRVGTSARIQWTTLSESDVAGFRVYREATSGGRVNITRRLLPARGDAFSGRAYSFLDRGAPGGAVRYWVEEVDSSGHASPLGSVHVAPVLRNKGQPGPNDPLVLPDDVIQYEAVEGGDQFASEEVDQ